MICLLSYIGFACVEGSVADKCMGGDENEDDITVNVNIMSQGARPREKIKTLAGLQQLGDWYT